MTYFDRELTSPNQQKRYETKNVKKTETHFDWATLILNQSRSILPKPIKRNFNASFCLFTMKAFKFLRGLFGKKDRRKKEIDGGVGEPLFSRAGGSSMIRGDRGDGGGKKEKKVQSPLRVFRAEGIRVLHSYPDGEDGWPIPGSAGVHASDGK